MCTDIREQTEITGSGKGPSGWMRLESAGVSYDHPFHAQLEHAIGVDFVGAPGAPAGRIAVELTIESARRLAHAILAAADRAEAYERS